MNDVQEDFLGQPHGITQVAVILFMLWEKKLFPDFIFDTVWFYRCLCKVICFALYSTVSKSSKLHCSILDIVIHGYLIWSIKEVLPMDANRNAENT